MDCVTLVPARDLTELGEKELTAVSADLFVSIPGGIHHLSLYLGPARLQRLNISELCAVE
jgi:hypothetical protein